MERPGSTPCPACRYTRGETHKVLKPSGGCRTEGDARSRKIRKRCKRSDKSLRGRAGGVILVKEWKTNQHGPSVKQRSQKGGSHPPTTAFVHRRDKLWADRVPDRCAKSDCEILLGRLLPCSGPPPPFQLGDLDLTPGFTSPAARATAREPAGPGVQAWCASWLCLQQPGPWASCCFTSPTAAPEGGSAQDTQCDHPD